MLNTMTNFIPIFPLSVVVYPGEKLNLHIFEPRYKQLVKECIEAKKPFGIPTVMGSTVKDFGCTVSVTEVKKEYPNGEMDICTKGENIFHVLEIIKELPEKLYSGAIVSYPEISQKPRPILTKKVLGLLREMHKQLQVSKDFGKPDNELVSFDMAHHAGMSIEEEFELLQLTEEHHRLEFIRRHINKVAPVVSQMRSLQEKIKLNGHFKNLEGFDFI